MTEEDKRAHADHVHAPADEEQAEGDAVVQHHLQEVVAADVDQRRAK